MIYRYVRWSTFGQYFGYPQCCIDAFLDDTCQLTKDRYPDGPWMGTGYIPCPCCAEKAIGDFDEFIATVIAPARSVAAPFPEEGCDEEAEAVFMASWQQVPRFVRFKHEVAQTILDTLDGLSYLIYLVTRGLKSPKSFFR